MNRLLESFCKYVRVDTMAVEGSTTYPSSPGQLVLGRMLADELQAMGAQSVEQTPEGIVFATIPASEGAVSPVIAWIAHVDTSPETSGHGVHPVVHALYSGDDIFYPGVPGLVLRASKDPELARLRGSTIITSDGTTLLGADDKAGVAVIMEAARRLLENPTLPRPTIRICFTCDEEIGRGTDHVDLAKLGARVGYTLDGGGTGEIDSATFSADLAIVKVRGINIHPSIAKGRMVNAVRLAGIFIDRLPRQLLSPETTSEDQGFLHPYRIDGGVEETRIQILLRDFRTEALAEQARFLREVARHLELEFPGAHIDVETRAQYRNMADGLTCEPRAVSLAEMATRRAGVAPRVTRVRGGTDGSRFTEKGLPCPNLSCGEHNPHSPLEWTCLEEMDAACRVLLELAACWADVRV